MISYLILKQIFFATFFFLILFINFALGNSKIFFIFLNFFKFKLFELKKKTIKFFKKILIKFLFFIQHPNFS